MTITLNVKPSLEVLLRDQAAREGIDANELVLRTVEQAFGFREQEGKSVRETELLQLITQGPTEAAWQRYHELAQKRDAESLTTAEHQELIALSEEIEGLGVDRLEHLAELARLRGVTLSSLQHQLAIPAPGTTRA